VTLLDGTGTCSDWVGQACNTNTGTCLLLLHLQDGHPVSLNHRDGWGRGECALLVADRARPAVRSCTACMPSPVLHRAHRQQMRCILTLCLCLSCPLLPATRQVLGLPAALAQLGWAGGILFLVFSIWVR
jgi:hypothetical protein